MTNGHFRVEAILPDEFGPVQNHVLLLDRSFSMTEPDCPPSRFDLAMAALVAYLARVFHAQPTSMVTVVSFSDTADVLCPWTRVDVLRDLGAVQETWLQACREFGLNDTGIGEGLQEALLLVVAQRGTTQVVVLTDGHQNTGVDPLQVAPQLKNLATVAVVGIGGSPSDVDEELLRTIASRDRRGRPRYRWIGHERSALIAHYEQLAGGLARE